MKVTPAALRQVLRKSLSLLKKGWTQNSYERHTYNAKDQPVACYCAAGAIIAASVKIVPYTSVNFADPNRDKRNALTEAAYAAIKKVVKSSGQPHDAVTSWNDRKTRTQAQVIAAFERAIEAA